MNFCGTKPSFQALEVYSNTFYIHHFKDANGCEVVLKYYNQQIRQPSKQVCDLDYQLGNYGVEAGEEMAKYCWHSKYFHFSCQVMKLYFIKGVAEFKVCLIMQTPQ